MKDRQADLVSQSGFPVIGQLLHWLSMPAAVCLRSSFGYLFLRPRSIFLSFSLAFTLLFIVAWNEPLLWKNYAALCSFALAVSWLYILHLILSFRAQLKERGEHDLYSGRSHALRIAMALGASYSKDLEIFIKDWIEPAVVLIAAIVVHVMIREQLLFDWLVLLSVFLWTNEFRVRWHALRKKKRLDDLRSDTEEGAEDHQSTPEVEAPKGTRKPKQKHIRSND